MVRCGGLGMELLTSLSTPKPTIGFCNPLPSPTVFLGPPPPKILQTLPPPIQPAVKGTPAPNLPLPRECSL